MLRQRCNFFEIMFIIWPEFDSRAVHFSFYSPYIFNFWDLFDKYIFYSRPVFPDLSALASQLTMNAMATSPTDLILESNNGSGSDSDTNHDDAPEYYQPISAVDDDDDEHQEGLSDQVVNSDEEHHYDNMSNGYVNRVENGILSLHVGEFAAEEEEEEEMMREASDTAIRRAFREDESRRNAPLTPENAMRVREAMRGVSFAGLTPDWANQVPEDRWIDQLRRLRQPQRPSGTV
ncbi:uncharacterized protein LOC111284709 [Durio zibethinus]|uniref:Uncharacterized protein LOC111284709 n=1 Tax=Durio zibethinus TaxID=66656 RepID=A0A6P5XM86_DURZI|nr:uncharacterized protein LOC111284709 [Durio zibethinus]